MQTYIALFDVLGFKEFIFNNEFEEVVRIFNHLLRDTQTAVSGETYLKVNEGTVIPDMQKQKVNCLHISDCIIFWTNSATEEDFKNIIDVCHTFYWRSLRLTFPVRGCLTFGDVAFDPMTLNKGKEAVFLNYSLIGKGLVNAYVKAESIDYAGCLLDQAAIDKAGDQIINKLIHESKICLYKVPFKTGFRYEHVFRPSKFSYNDVSFRNAALDIQRLFTAVSNTTVYKLPESVKTKMNNTIDFIHSFKQSSNPE